MSDTENPTGGQPPESGANTAFERQLALLDPDEERQVAELGMADYAALVAADEAGAVEDGCQSRGGCGVVDPW